jgi:RHS repeat-associated core domain
MRFKIFYNDQSASAQIDIADTLDWQFYSVKSLPGKIVKRVELLWWHTAWVYLGNVEVLAKNQLWDSDYVVNNEANPSSYPVTKVADETYNSFAIDNIIRLHQCSFFYSSNYYSLVNPSLLNIANLTLNYWIRKESFGTDIRGLRFKYSDGTYSPTTVLENNGDWQFFSINSTTGKIVTAIELEFTGTNYSWILLGNIQLMTESCNLLWNNDWTIKNTPRQDFSIITMPDELTANHYVENTIRLHQESFYNSGVYFSLVNPQALINGGEGLQLSYWARKETAGANVAALRFKYSDGSYSPTPKFVDNTAWQKFTLISASGKTVVAVELPYNTWNWIRIGSIHLIGIHGDIWSTDWAMQNDTNKASYQVNPVALDTTPVTDIVRMHQGSYYLGNEQYASLIESEKLIDCGQLTINYWIRKESVTGNYTGGFRFYYSDGTYSDSIYLKDTTDWQNFVILSNPNKIVIKVVLYWNYICWVRIGNVRVEGQSAGKLDGRLTGETLINNYYAQYSYDTLGRQTSVDIKQIKDTSAAFLKETYTYLNGTGDYVNNTSYTVTSKAIAYGISGGVTYNYTYCMDNALLGSDRATRPNPYNIWQIKEGSTVKVEYYYDALGRLIRENNAYINATVVYAYDLNNNLLSKTTYTLTYGNSSLSGGTAITYVYGNSTFKDRLTSYNGQAITYNDFGLPTSYLGKTLTWNGRELATWSNGSSTYSYIYDMSGLRLSKTTGSTVTNYLYEGSKLVREIKGSDTIWYIYDQNGITGLQINGTSYYYVRNLQGDITKMVNTSGAVVVEYVYDSWGKVISTTGSLASTVGVQNPFRYRGYYYDTESNLYYLISRYYDPTTGRFISPDSIAQDGNLYTYCGDDPINFIDVNGNKGLSVNAYRWIKLGAGMLMVSTGVAVTALTLGLGAAAGVAISAAGSTILGAAISTIITAATGGEVNGDTILDNTLDSFIWSGPTSMVGPAVTSVYNSVKYTSQFEAEFAKSSANLVARTIEPTEVIGSSKNHGSLVHQEAIDSQVNSMVNSGNYSKIYINRSLSSAGLKGGQRPDIIGIGRNGVKEYWEFASYSQRAGKGLWSLWAKMDIMDATNGLHGIYIPFGG